MGLVKTVVAYCDATDVLPGGGTKDCFERVSLNPQTNQPWRDLTDLGWKTDVTADDIKTICPKHGERLKTDG